MSLISKRLSLFFLPNTYGPSLELSRKVLQFKKGTWGFPGGLGIQGRDRKAGMGWWGREGGSALSSTASTGCSPAFRQGRHEAEPQLWGCGASLGTFPVTKVVVEGLFALGDYLFIFFFPLRIGKPEHRSLCCAMGLSPAGYPGLPPIGEASSYMYRCFLLSLPDSPIFLVKPGREPVTMYTSVENFCWTENHLKI